MRGGDSRSGEPTGCSGETLLAPGQNGGMEAAPAPAKQLLVVCQSRSGGTTRLVEAFVEGTASEGIEGVATRVLAPLDADVDDVLGADAVVLAAPANFGMINGLMKDFLERIYHPCLEATVGTPYALVVKGDTDGTGAVRDTDKILTGLRWKSVQPPLVVIGPLADEHLDAARELGATIAGGLAFDLW